MSDEKIENSPSDEGRKNILQELSEKLKLPKNKNGGGSKYGIMKIIGVILLTLLFLWT